MISSIMSKIVCKSVHRWQPNALFKLQYKRLAAVVDGGTTTTVAAAAVAETCAEFLH